MTEKTDENKIKMDKVAKYWKEHDWWNSNDPADVASGQICEQILMVKFDVFHEGMEKLLGRPVWTHEFADVKRLQ